ncbi:Dps family protein [Aquimarina litoralis]|uniref:Dps family protein n=1 Tax=Aquimarina litoralis TaxID=584605 RepID=UPI001C55F1A8|nr:DNA starvation/stationary phase protection protein [Aquimarina litoralis]MBW1298372.1 DNA starvation/stationary phase protection protein [Aquimarina litoralis]
MINTNKETIELLNVLLADYHMYYQKLRNFHWNVKGRNFFELHLKFEELYEDAKLKIDEIAERILTLRAKPISNYSSFIEKSSIKEASTDLIDNEMVTSILEDHDIILKQLKLVTKEAEKAEDDGTLDITGTYIADLEKTSWMLDAWNQKP